MAGAGFYTLGAVVELANWPVLVPGVIRSHELLHFSDMVGTACHIVFILKYVLPYRPGQWRRRGRMARPRGSRCRRKPDWFDSLFNTRTPPLNALHRGATNRIPRNSMADP